MNYESEEWQSLPGGVMRPGGLALTKETISGLSEGSYILDLGCGEGAAVRLLNEMGHPAVGLDISDVLINRGLAYGDGRRLIRGDSSDMPFEKEAFDAVIAECSLSEMCLCAALRECNRVLRANGLMMITDLYLKRETEAHETSKHTGLFTRPGWENALSESGFIIKEFKDRTELLLEFMVRSVWMHRKAFSDMECIQYIRGYDPKSIGYFFLAAQKSG